MNIVRFTSTGALLLILLIAFPLAGYSQDTAEDTPPNIIYIMVDDMGYHDLGCYGSTTIQTPNIDRIAAEGMRFTDCYSGDTVCASARSTLMTGLHKGHTPVRGNSGGIPLFPEDVTVAEVLKQGGYATGAFGKWGLGNQGHDGAAERQGFDHFFGYYNQWHAHTYYTHLFRNSEKVELDGRYTHYAIYDEAIQFLHEHHDEPFFLYCPWTPPHAAYEIPEEDPAYQLYKDEPWDNSAKVVAAMDTMMDRQIGEIMALLKEYKIDDNTIVFFTSDNGAAKRFDGIHNSCGVMQGHKRSLFEGGIRVPMVVRWPGHIEAGSESDLPWYFPDVMPTLADLAGLTENFDADATINDSAGIKGRATMDGGVGINYVPEGIDGISILPTLLGQGEQQERDYLFWEFGGKRAVRSGTWKGILSGDNFALYDLSEDRAEQNDLADEQPEIAQRLRGYAEEAYEEQRSQQDDGKYTGK